jgi:hypothetical protein
LQGDKWYVGVRCGRATDTDDTHHIGSIERGILDCLLDFSAYLVYECCGQTLFHVNNCDFLRSLAGKGVCENRDFIFIIKSIVSCIELEGSRKGALIELACEVGEGN